MYKEIYERAKHYEDTNARFLMDIVKIPSFSTKEKRSSEAHPERNASNRNG